MLLTLPTALLFAAGYLLRWRNIPRYWIWFGYINWCGAACWPSGRQGCLLCAPLLPPPRAAGRLSHCLAGCAGYLPRALVALGPSATGLQQDRVTALLVVPGTCHGRWLLWGSRQLDCSLLRQTCT